MATSKALQTQQWWEEISESTNIKCSLYPNWLERARGQAGPMTNNVNDDYAESATLLSDEITDQVIHLTAHARVRLAQRNLSIDEINYVLLYGQTWHKAGAVINYLRQKDIPRAEQVDQRRQRLIGATVVTAQGRRIVLTAYRNRHSGLRKIKRKPEYGWN